MMKTKVRISVLICGCLGLFLLGIIEEKPTIAVADNEEILFTDKRPTTADSSVIVAIPAAYSCDFAIIGHYSVGNGRLGTTDKRYTTVRLDKNSYFQQASLVRNGKAKIFSDSRIRYRRALCKKGSRFSIVHSCLPQTLSSFAENLSSDYDHAWNLDMGTYSYGWYRKDGKIHHLGLSTIWNKRKQTNWIIVKKKKMI